MQPCTVGLRHDQTDTEARLCSRYRAQSMCGVHFLRRDDLILQLNLRLCDIGPLTPRSRANQFDGVDLVPAQVQHALVNRYDDFVDDDFLFEF